MQARRILEDGRARLLKAMDRFTEVHEQIKTNPQLRRFAEAQLRGVRGLERTDLELAELLRHPTLDGRWREAERKFERLLRKQARRGARGLEIESSGGRDGMVSIEDDEAFKLPPKLFRLLTLLSDQARRAEGPDDPRGWVSIDSLAKSLVDKGQPPMEVHAVDNLISRLRLQFRLHGHNPFLIDKSTELGARVILADDDAPLDH